MIQVPQVTEEAAQAVVELYPTLFLLAKAYSVLVSPLPTKFVVFIYTGHIVTYVQDKCLWYIPCLLCCSAIVSLKILLRHL